MPIILQTDIRTVIIKSSLSNVTSKISEIDRVVGEIVGRTATLDINRLGSRKDLDLLSRTIEPLRQIATSLSTQLDRTLQVKDSKKREERAIEFIGSALNWISGVPTAEDHRKVLEQINQLRLDEVTSVNELKSQNMLTHQALQNMQVQETEISDLKQTISKLRVSQYEGAGISLRTIAVQLVSNQVQQLANSVERDIRHIERVLDRSDSQLLDRSAISVHELSGIVDRIFLQNRNSTPVFQQEDCHYYYSLPLAHSWVSEDRGFLMTLLQVPISSVGQSNIMTVLDPLNKIFPELPMAVVNPTSNYFRYLSLTDIDNCHQLTSHLLCMKREINIVPAHGCSIQLSNCKVWATDVVHDLTNTEIMIILSKEMEATVSCDNKTDSMVQLPNRSIIKLSINCQLKTQQFVVKKLSYRHLSDESSSLFSKEPIQILQDDELLRKRLNVHKDIPASELPKLKTLLENNENLMDQIRSNEEKSRSLWQNISGGQTPIEQILLWSFLSLSLFLSIFSMSIHVKYGCRNLRKKLPIKAGKRKVEEKEDGGTEMDSLNENLMELIQDVNQRLRNLETQQLRRQNRTTRLAITDNRRPEELDV